MANTNIKLKHKSQYDLKKKQILYKKIDNNNNLEMVLETGKIVSNSINIEHAYCSDDSLHQNYVSFIAKYPPQEYL
jgi:hypothetical protein